MKVPLEWLKEYVPVRLPTDQLAERLTMAGLEVKAIEAPEAGPIFDIEVTPNRPDCLSIIGIARELAAATGQSFKAPRISAPAKPRKNAVAVSIRIEDAAACGLYIGRLIEGVKVGPSPDWMQKRLLACGARPINNLVDITNYVLFEYGQPLHAFDFEKLKGGTIIVRRAREGEPLRTLDGLDRKLDAQTLVIADAEKAVAVAGIMGGMGSEVTESTRRVLLESAWFEPKLIRRTGRRLGLASESSYRFERGVGTEGVAQASARASVLIQDLAGGHKTAMKAAGGLKPKPRVVAMDLDRAERWLGTPIPAAKAKTILRRFSFAPSGKPSARAFKVAVPSFRLDVSEPCDLFEELARGIGYDRISPTLPRLEPSVPAAVSRYAQLRALKAQAAAAGLVETVNWSLVSEAELARFGYPPAAAARLVNPLNQDFAFLRPTLAIGLSKTARRNLSHGATGVRLFELGAIVRPKETPAEQTWLGILLAGEWMRDWRTRQAADFYLFKGLIENLFGAAAKQLQWVPAEGAAIPWAESGQGTLIRDAREGSGTVGLCARLSAAIAKALDIDAEVWCGGIRADALLKAQQADAVREIPTLPPVKRDLSILVKGAIGYADIERTIRETGGSALTQLALIDRYTGSSLPPGTCSLTFSLAYRDPARTLTAEEADAIHQGIVAKLQQAFEASLR